jgi:hypothetical protein
VVGPTRFFTEKKKKPKKIKKVKTPKKIFSFVYPFFFFFFTSLSKVMRQQDIAYQRALYTKQYPELLDGVVSET